MILKGLVYQLFDLMSTKFIYIGLILILLMSIQVQAQVSEKDIDYFMQAALKNSPLTRDFKNQQQAIKIDSMLVLAASGPQVFANSAGMYAPVVGGYGYDEVITNGRLLAAMLNVNYDLLNKKKIKNQLQNIKLQSDSIRYASEVSLFELKRLIIDQYITAYTAQQQAQFDQEIFSLLKKEEVLLKQLTRSNLFKQTEYLTFLVTLQQQQLASMQSELQYKNDFATLNYLSGITDTAISVLGEPKMNQESLHSQNTFFIKKFDIDSLKNINQKAAINLSYSPKLGIYANSGYNSSLMLQPYKNFGASMGFSFSTPIYDGHQKKMQYDKLELSNHTAGGYKNFFIRQQKQQLNIILQQLAATGGLLMPINVQVKFAKRLIEVNSKLLSTGDIKISDYIIAINSYMSSKNLLRQTITNRLKLINQFNYWNK